MNTYAVQITICDCCDNISFKIIKFANVIKSWIWFYIVYGTIVYGSIGFAVPSVKYTDLLTPLHYLYRFMECLLKFEYFVDEFNIFLQINLHNQSILNLCYSIF